jgi:hypothetical protein
MFHDPGLQWASAFLHRQPEADAAVNQRERNTARTFSFL